MFLGVFLNNNRLNDVKELLGAKIDAMGGKIEVSRAGASVEIADLRVLMERNHSETLVRFTDIEGRLTRIENERRIV